MDSEKYDSWIKAKSKLDFWKKEEANLRVEICEHFLAEKPVGTYNFNKGLFKIKASKKLSISMDEKALSFIYDDLSYEQQNCIKYEPSLIIKEYKACEHDLLDMAVVSKPAMPTLSIVKED